MEEKAITPRDEIGFRKVYSKLVNDKKVTTIFRPGERLCGINKGFCEDEILNIRIIDKVGADLAQLKPQIVPSDAKVRVTNTKVTKLAMLTPEDFIGSTPDVYDKQSLIYNLGIIYNIDISEFTDDFVITRTTFTYL